MLHEFIATNRDEIISRTRERVGTRPWPTVTTHELEHGVPLFLTQPMETLRLETTGTLFSPDAIGRSAALYGGELPGKGCVFVIDMPLAAKNAHAPQPVAQ